MRQRLEVYKTELARLLREEQTSQEVIADLTARLTKSEEGRVAATCRLARLESQTRPLPLNFTAGDDAHAGHASVALQHNLDDVRLLTNVLAQQHEASAEDQRTIKQLNRKLAETEQLYQVAEHARTVILDSTSWKLTKPVRALVSIFRKTN